MTPVITAVRMTGAAHRAELPLLVLGPSLGSSAAALWSAVAPGLTDHFDVLAWDLPGHGHNRSVPDVPPTLAELASGVLAVVDDVQAHRDDLGVPFAYAGVGAGADVGLQLLIDTPLRVGSAVLLGSVDVPDRLDEAGAPVLAVAGADDPPTTLESLRRVAAGVPRGALKELAGTSQLAPVDRPDEVATLIRRHVLGPDDHAPDEGDGAGLDARSRALVTLAVLHARGARGEELGQHVRAATGAGLTHDEVDEVLRIAREAPGAAWK